MWGESIISVVLTVLLAAPAGDSRLADAAMKGDQTLVQSLLAEKADVNAAQGDGNTALHWAAYRDDMQLGQLLITAKANVMAKTRIGEMTPLHLAATNGNAEFVQVLLKAGANPNVANGNGTTPLMLAAAAGRVEAIKTLIDAGAEVNATDATNGQTAVMFAAAMNRAAAIKLLSERGANLKLVTKVAEVKPNNSDRQARAEERTRNVATVGGNTALHFAARDGNLAAIEALLAAGADVNQVSATDAMSPLVQAIINGRYDVAMYLLKHGADPNIVTKKAGLAPLWAAIDSRFAPRAWYPSPNVEQEKTSHLDLVQELIARGANINHRLVAKPWFRTFGDSNGPDPVGSTAFWRAAYANDLPALKLLLAAGANPTIASKLGTTPLFVACGLQQDFQGGNFVPEARLDVVRFLVEDVGADVNAQDVRGYTPLHGAAYLGRNDIIMYLVAHGADVTIRANQISNGPSTQNAKAGEGDTVADMANGWTEKTLQFPESVALLRNLGSAFSNTCWASVCVNPTRLDKKTNP